MGDMRLKIGEIIREFRLGKRTLFYVWFTPTRMGITHTRGSAREKILAERGRY